MASETGLVTPSGVIAVWIAALAIVLIVVVPVAVTLLQRALRAARDIERYFLDMKDAGVAIAGNTSAIPALNDTIKTAVAMKPVAESIRDKSAAVAGMLAQRAKEAK